MTYARLDTCTQMHARCRATSTLSFVSHTEIVEEMPVINDCAETCMKMPTLLEADSAQRNSILSELWYG